MSQEIAKVLQMIEEGKLTADEGLALLEPLQDDAGVSPPLRQEQTDPGRKKKLRIKISDAPSGKAKVNLSIPVGLVKLLPGLIPEGIKKRAGDIDLNRFLDDLFEGLGATDPSEKLIDVVDDDNGDRVEIYFA